MSNILQYHDLVGIPVQESGEPMVVVQEVAPEIVCRYEKMDMIHYLGDLFALRAGIIKRLVNASASLQIARPGAKLRLAYGYRHPDVQTAYFEQRKREVHERAPNLSEEQLVQKTHLLTASPDVAGHPTGGAIDVTIEDADGTFDMGTDIADFSSDKIETFADGLTDAQIENRALLRRVLLNAGFAPFDGEWWHFSYGDREWAAYYKKPNAIYDQVTFGNKK